MEVAFAKMHGIVAIVVVAVLAGSASASDGGLKAPACLGPSRPAPFHDFSDVLGAEYTPAIAGGDRFWVRDRGSLRDCHELQLLIVAPPSDWLCVMKLTPLVGLIEFAVVL